MIFCLKGVGVLCPFLHQFPPHLPGEDRGELREKLKKTAKEEGLSVVSEMKP